MSRHAAVDLGASGGRVVVGEVTAREFSLDVVHRFANRPVRLPSGLHWDVLGLYGQALDGLRLAGQVQSIGIDSWAVDYGLLDASGALLGNPFHYRDDRTLRGVEAVHRHLSPAELRAVNGLQHLPFNTIYQLAADEQLDRATTLLLIPDLVANWLTGAVGAELTNASTTGLLDIASREWSEPVTTTVGLPHSLLPPLRRPGDVLGALRPSVRDELRWETAVIAVGSHDTASAVVAVPMSGDDAAFVSLGTWGLVGVELEQPVLSEASREANFTNELGVDGRVRFLRNVMGLWLLQECLRWWGMAATDLGPLLAAASEVPRQPVFDVDHPSLLVPGDIPGRVCAIIDEMGYRAPRRRPQLVRCVLDSLADALGRAVREAGVLSGRELRVVHVVGGGAQNDLLCQLLADVSGLAVVAGPVEATAIGNLLVQARAQGTLSGDLETLRDLVRGASSLHRFEPRP